MNRCFPLIGRILSDPGTLMGRGSTWIFALAFLIAGARDAWGWGGTGHKFVNRNAIIHLSPSMATLAAQQSFLEAHASDADYRKSADTAESPKHFLDLESIPRSYQHFAA